MLSIKLIPWIRHAAPRDSLIIFWGASVVLPQGPIMIQEEYLNILGHWVLSVPTSFLLKPLYLSLANC